jgi:hypothetical protein
MTRLRRRAKSWIWSGRVRRAAAAKALPLEFSEPKEGEGPSLS